MISLLNRLLGRLLPFATPGTPLIQDLIHLGAICALLYYGPQIQDRIQRARASGPQGDEAQAPTAQEQPAQPDHNGQRAAQETLNPGERDQLEFAQEADRQDEGPDNNDFQQFQREQINNNAAEAGPANAANQRNVGAKKAKSLARRDQRRAYHEFQRAQGEAQRAREAEGATEREAAQAAERERRKAAEAKLEARKAKEREEKREQERIEREAEIARREKVVSIVREELEYRRMCNLFEAARRVGGDADDVWVEKILNASGLLGKGGDGALTMITSTGWVVRVREEDMALLYKRAAEENLSDEEGNIGYDQIGPLLERILKEGSAGSP